MSGTDEGLRYEISILIGPCSQETAEEAMEAAHQAVSEIEDCGPGTALNYWDESKLEPGRGVQSVDIMG